MKIYHGSIEQVVALEIRESNRTQKTFVHEYDTSEALKYVTFLDAKEVVL